MVEVARPLLVIADLDGTLAESRIQIKKHLAEKVAELTLRMPLAIMSAASFDRIVERALPDVLPHAKTDNLYVFAAGTSQCFKYENNAWRNVYDMSISASEREHIVTTITDVVNSSDMLEQGWDENKKYFEDSGSSITFAALGVEASPEGKKKWDPDRTKRTKVRDRLASLLPEYGVYVSGNTSIDVFKKGVNKEHGVRFFAHELGFQPSEMLFIGDSLYEGGNDAPVISTGIQTLMTTGPKETERLIDELLK